MFGPLGYIILQLLCIALVRASPDDPIILVTDQKDGDYVGYIHSINKTSDLVKTIPGYKTIRPVAIGYDSSTERIYWSDVVTKEIRTSTLTGDDEHTFKHLDTKAIADGITIDTLDRLLFYTDAGNDVIVSVSLKYPYKRMVIIDRDLEKPRGITIFHERKLIIWSDWSTWASIQLSSYTGTDRRTLVNSDIQWPNGVTLDQTNEILYWCDAGMDRIESIKLDGSQRRTILNEPGTHYFGIFFFEQSLFLTDWKSKSVRQLSLNGTEIHRVTAERFYKLTGIILLRVSRCRPGTYGDDCTGVCGHCVAGTTCGKVTGLCMNGCQLGFYGEITEVNVTASMCNKPCQCELCQSQTFNCPVGCRGQWYNSTCEVAIVTSTSFLSPSTTASSSTTKEYTVDGTEEHLSTASPENDTTYEVFLNYPSAGEVKSRQSTNWAAIPVLSCAVFVLLIAYILHVRKLRRDVKDLKNYDHLRYRRSVSTVVTRHSHDYSTIETVAEEEEGDALTKGKVYPDVSLYDAPHTLDKEEVETSQVLTDEESPYRSIGSLSLSYIIK